MDDDYTEIFAKICSAMTANFDNWGMTVDTMDRIDGKRELFVKVRVWRTRGTERLNQVHTFSMYTLNAMHHSVCAVSIRDIVAHMRSGLYPDADKR